MKLLKQAIELGADFIDIELAAGEKAIKQLQSFCRRQKSHTRIIVSWHDISKTPSLAKLKEIFQACAQTGADIVKIVPYARKMADNLKVLSLITYAKAQNRRNYRHVHGRSGENQPRDGAAAGEVIWDLPYCRAANNPRPAS